jgi:hypothetical protein
MAVLTQITLCLVSLMILFLMVIIVGQQERMISLLDQLVYGEGEDEGGSGYRFDPDPDTPPEDPDELTLELLTRIREIRASHR